MKEHDHDHEPLRLCVIDDIETVVEGLTQAIDWPAYGIVVAGTASNGEDGLALIKQVRPHIIVSDIRMPLKSGLEMVRKLLENQEEQGVKVIFMSGYSDFSYARDSLRLGAFDYVLKPFTRKQMTEVVCKARDALLSERLELENRLELERKVRASSPYLRQEYFRLLLRTTTAPEQVERKWAFLDIAMARTHFAVMIVEMDRFVTDIQQLPVSEAELARFAIQNILEETIARYTQGIVIREHVHQFICIYNWRAELDMADLGEQCRRNIQQYAKRTASIGIGEMVVSMGEIHRSFEQAKRALAYQFYSGGNCVISFSDISRSEKAAPHYQPEQETELLYCLRSGNKEGALRQLEMIYESIFKTEEPSDPALLIHVLYGLAFSMFRVVAEKVEPAQWQELERRLSAFKNGDPVTAEEARTVLTAFCALACEWMQRTQRSDSRQLIVEIQTYIQQHLSSELTVQECANVVHLSPSYFSNLFKKETGMTFMQYVTQARMELAKTRLLEGVQVQELAYELGYKDRPYFSELFKKYIGLTPTEFRQKYEDDRPHLS